MNNKPIRLTPAFKDYLWGGTKLKTEFNKKSDLDIVAESWELSTHKDGASIVSGGEFDGLTLNEYIEKNGRECIGSNAMKFDFFPILIKFIDAKGALSIQVHPSDEYALEHEGEYGKTEMWYILDCEPGAFLYYGLNRTVTKEEFAERIKNNTILEILNKTEVHKGDVFFIEAGTVHAIGAGIVICEIQQNSNTTYRVYDYDRRDKFGNARELHIDKAIQVSNLFPAPKPAAPCGGSGSGILASCRYFTAEKLTVDGEAVFDTDKSCFRSVIVTNGSGELTAADCTLELKKGDSIFIPAQDGKCRITGQCEVIISYV